MSKREVLVLKVIFISGLLGTLAPVGMLWSIGTAPAIWAAICFGTVIFAGVYLAITGED